jgi:hypothetical protein
MRGYPQIVMYLLEHCHPSVEAIANLFRVSLPSVHQRLVLTLYRAAEDSSGHVALDRLITAVPAALRPDIKRSTAIALFDVARRRLAQSLHRIQYHPRYSQVLVQVDPVMAAWVCGDHDDNGLCDERNPFAGMDSATTAPAVTPGVDDDGRVSATLQRTIIHPATLSATSALLALIVDLLSDAKAAAGEETSAHDGLLVQAKHMLDMTRVLKTELPGDAALDRL